MQHTDDQVLIPLIQALLQEEPNTLTGKNMIEYLTELFQEVCAMGWSFAKQMGAHLVVMSKKEDGLIT